MFYEILAQVGLLLLQGKNINLFSLWFQMQSISISDAFPHQVCHTHFIEVFNIVSVN